MAVAARSEDDTTSRLKSLFSASHISALWMVRTKNDLCYYRDKEFTRDDLMMVGDKLIVLYRETLDYQDDDAPKRVPIKATDIVFIGPAPHSRLANRFLGLLSSVTPQKWDTTFLRMTTELLQEPDIDPVLRLRLLYELLATAGAGSYPLAKALAPQAAETGNAKGYRPESGLVSTG